MKYLFEMDDEGLLTFAPQVLAIDCFSKLWKRRRKNKELAVKELSAIYFYIDIRSPYNRIEPERRWSQIVPDIFDEEWEPDEVIDECIDKYQELSRTPSMDTLDAARKAQKELDRFLQEVDLNERDDKGKPVFNAKQVMDMIKALPDTVRSMQDTQRLVETEINESLILRGGREKGEFEDDSTNPD